MKALLLKEASSNGHDMVRISPDRYECSNTAQSECKAVIWKDHSGNWQSKRTTTFCMEAKVSLTPLGRCILNQALQSEPQTTE